MSKLNIEKAREKHWIIDDGVVAKYKFNRCTYDSLLPEFNSEFKYYYTDESYIYKDVTRSIYAADNDFIDITKCVTDRMTMISRFAYSPTPPMQLDDAIYFAHDDWNSLYIDLSEYKGKEINISFTLEYIPNDYYTNWSELNIGFETCDCNEIEDIIVMHNTDHTDIETDTHTNTYTIPNEDCMLYIGGTFINLKDIVISVDGKNLFPDYMRTDYCYIQSRGKYVNRPAYVDGELRFTYEYNFLHVRCDQFIGKEVTISFDAEACGTAWGINAYRVQESNGDVFFSDFNITNEHYEKTFTIDQPELTIYASGVKITNLSVVVDNRSEDYQENNQLPTFMCFGDNESENGNDATNSLLELIYANTSNLTSMKNMFNCCEKMYLCNTSNWNTSKVTNMYCVFAACRSLKSINVSSFDTSKVTDMDGMFANCKTLEYLDVANFDTSNVTDMEHMFVNCHKLERLNLANFNVKNVSSMRNMFINCTGLKTLNVPGWRIINVASPDLYRMFYNCTNLENLDISYWNITNGYNLTQILDGNNMLKHIKMIGCNSNTINKIIATLPTTNTVDGAKIYTSLNTNLSFINNTPSNWEVVRGNDVKSHVYLSKQVQEILLKNRNLKQIHVGDTKTMYYR